MRDTMDLVTELLGWPSPNKKFWKLQNALVKVTASLSDEERSQRFPPHSADGDARALAYIVGPRAQRDA